MLVPSLLLLVGIVVLVIGGDLMVRGAAALARHWGIPALIVGLTIVAFGTSAPELVVAVQAVRSGVSELATGNIVGSNVANVLLALGLPAMIMAIPTNMPGVARNAFVCVLATLIYIALAIIPPLFGHTTDMIYWQGAILFGGIIVYLAWMFRLARIGAEDPILAEMTEIDEGEAGLPTQQWKSALFLIFGLVGLVLGGKMIVDNATIIAEALEVPKALIGLTIVAIGTSLPEIATVIIAAYRGHPEVAIGNVLGSNVFNLFAVGGAAALAGPVGIPGGFKVFDFWVMLVSTIALTIYILSRNSIGRKTGFIFLIAYVLYMGAQAKFGMA